MDIVGISSKPMNCHGRGERIWDLLRLRRLFHKKGPLLNNMILQYKCPSILSTIQWTLAKIQCFHWKAKSNQCYWWSRPVATTSALGGQESAMVVGPTGPGSRFTIRCTQPRQLCNVLLGAGDKHIHKRSLPIDLIVFVNIFKEVPTR